MNSKKISNVFTCFTVFILMILISSNVYATQSLVDLGTAEDFVVLAKSGISTTGTTSIVGNIGVSPIDSTAITGFGLTMDSSNEFSRSSLINGKAYAADYTSPTPSVMSVAISDMETAYNDAAGRILPDYTELGAGNIGGMTLSPGLYKWSTGVIIPTDVTLNGDSKAVWIFQIAGTLDISSATKVILMGGAQAKNVFWQVADQVTLETTSTFNGNILGQTAIVLNTGATLNGRALAQTAVTFDSNIVSMSTRQEITTTNNHNTNDKPREDVIISDSSTRDDLANKNGNDTSNEFVQSQTIYLDDVRRNTLTTVAINENDGTGHNNTGVVKTTSGDGKVQNEKKPSLWNNFVNWFRGIFGKR